MQYFNTRSSLPDPANLHRSTMETRGLLFFCYPWCKCVLQKMLFLKLFLRLCWYHSYNRTKSSIFQRYFLTTVSRNVFVLQKKSWIPSLIFMHAYSFNTIKILGQMIRPVMVLDNGYWSSIYRTFLSKC